MNPVEIVTLLVAVTVTVGELWYFLRPRASAASRNPGRAPAQEFRITVHRGFTPDLVFVEAGRPVRLQFYRSETHPRSERLVFDTLKIDKPLPEFETTSVEFIPSDSGDYRFRCGATCEGRVVAQIGGDAARANLGRGHQKHG